MEELKAAIKKRLDRGQKLEDVRTELVAKGYDADEVKKAAKIFDWMAEKKEFVESGKQRVYEQELQSKRERRLLRVVCIIAAGVVAVLLVQLMFGTMAGLIALALIFIIIAFGIVSAT